MLEEKVTIMTEAEIDAYYEKKEKESLKRIYEIQARREISRMRRHVFQMASLCIVATVLCTVFLQLSFSVQERGRRIDKLQNEIEILQLENEDHKKRIEDAQDLREIRKKAEYFGMCYPRQRNIVYYSVAESDYMCQMGAIPLE